MFLVVVRMPVECICACLATQSWESLAFQKSVSADARMIKKYLQHSFNKALIDIDNPNHKGQELIAD